MDLLQQLALPLAATEQTVAVSASGSGMALVMANLQWLGRGVRAFVYMFGVVFVFFGIFVFLVVFGSCSFYLLVFFCLRN